MATSTLTTIKNTSTPENLQELEFHIGQSKFDADAAFRSYLDEEFASYLDDGLVAAAAAISEVEPDLAGESQSDSLLPADFDSAIGNFGTRSPDDILQKIDDTLDLIAEAQSVASGHHAVSQIDISIVIPVHNARNSLPEVLDRIEEVMPMSCEVIVIDDASTDGSDHYVRGLTRHRNITLLQRRRHHGRGSAIRMGLRHTQGRVVAIQDADMAYDPADLLGAIWPILEEKADVVYGSRRLRRDTRRGVGFVARLSGRITTFLANRVTGLRLSDFESSHKVFRGDLIRSLDLRETDRGFDAEVTAKVASRAGVVMEVPTTFEGDCSDSQSAPRLTSFVQSVVSLLRYRSA